VHKKIKVLFVCMGNICRSPTAHAAFRDLIRKNNLVNKIMVDSAGTHAYHVGEAPDLRAQHVALNANIDMSDLNARKIEPDDLSLFDYILVMDDENKELVNALANGKYADKIRLFLEFASKDWGMMEVPDPYFGSKDGFARMFAMIEDACTGLLHKIQRDLH